MLSHPLCYLGVRFLRPENHEFSRFFIYDQLYQLEDTILNALDLTEFRNQFHYRKLLRGYVGDRFILSDLVIIMAAPSFQFL